MKAIDTYVVLRVVTGDNIAQEAVARDLLQSGALIPLTVVMETEWVLRSFYRWGRAEIADALTALAHVEGVIVERLPEVSWVIERYRAGADFTDMTHLLVEADVDGFATFDAGIAKAAGADAPLAITTLTA